MTNHLVNKDIDWLIAKQLLRDGRPRAMRSVNLLLITFGPLSDFAKICSTRYQQLMCRYRQVKSTDELIPPQIHNNSFWHTAIKNFTTAKPGETIVFDGGQKGDTRQKLYMLGTLFGCRWTVTGQKNEGGEMLLKVDAVNGYLNKRGIMCNGPGVITFTKL